MTRASHLCSPCAETVRKCICTSGSAFISARLYFFPGACCRRCGGAFVGWLYTLYQTHFQCVVFCPALLRTKFLMLPFCMQFLSQLHCNTMGWSGAPSSRPYGLAANVLMLKTRPMAAESMSASSRLLTLASKAEPDTSRAGSSESFASVQSPTGTMLGDAADVFMSLGSASVGTWYYYMHEPVVPDIGSLACFCRACMSDQDYSISCIVTASRVAKHVYAGICALD